MVCSIFRSYIVFLEMGSFHKNLTMYICLFPRSLTTQLGFNDVLFGIFYSWYLFCILTTIEGEKLKNKIALFFQP